MQQEPEIDKIQKLCDGLESPCSEFKGAHLVLPVGDAAVRLFHICDYCNVEYQLSLGVGLTGSLGHSFSQCTHCGKRNHVWIRVEGGQLKKEVEQLKQELCDGLESPCPEFKGASLVLPVGGVESDSVAASCDCLTKTPDYTFHKPGCKYRLISERNEARRELEDARDLLEIHRQFRESLDLPARKRITERKFADEQYSLACRELGIGEQSTDSGDTLLEAVCRLKNVLDEHRAALQSADDVNDKMAQALEKEREAGVDPKGKAGALKTPLHLIPPAASREIAPVHAHGAEKYGPYNWRDTPVQSLTYVAAIMRHLDAWRDGQDLDPESGLSHLAHIGANINIMLDAKACGMLVDNRHKVGEVAQ